MINCTVGCIDSFPASQCCRRIPNHGLEKPTSDFELSGNGNRPQSGKHFQASAHSQAVGIPQQLFDADLIDLSL
jgi:hypothetical protein